MFSQPMGRIYTSALLSVQKLTSTEALTERSSQTLNGRESLCRDVYVVEAERLDLRPIHPPKISRITDDDN
ncbi:hypothetical protein R3P38DRAFT_3184426 [Favolaschia claudopus]|uniref:Uncharacterized protein n=1 Tax=Favolaschia claudopus TaxID=2862362 RepID=A0AAW0C702_9AGAR